MIIHAALYRFRAGASGEQIEACTRALKTSTEQTKLAAWYVSGRHIALPADEAVRDMVYDFAALWGFADQQALDDFSRHPALAHCVATFIRPILEKLAIANFNETSEASWQMVERGEQKHVS